MNDKARTKKSRSDGEQSRERLLAAAMRLFAEQGAPPRVKSPWPPA